MIRWLAALLLVMSPVLAQERDSPARPSPAQILDRLFGLLKVAPDETTASAVEASIQGQWLAEATPATKLLIQHGFQELAANPSDSLDDFDAALDLQPELQEGWHGRAAARARLGDYVGAEHDIAEVMKREPRQFRALQDLSNIAEQRRDWRGAYEAWSRAMELDPKTSGGADKLKDLKRRAFGDTT